MGTRGEGYVNAKTTCLSAKAFVKKNNLSCVNRSNNKDCMKDLTPMNGNDAIEV